MTIGSVSVRPFKIPAIAITFAICLLLGSLIINLLMIITVYWRDPVTSFTWLTGNNEVACEASLLKTPSISQARIVDFAGSAAVSLNSYDYYNYQTLLNSAMRQYLTVGARASYTKALLASGILGKTRKEFIEVTAVTREQPNIAEQGVKDGREYWIVEVPLRIFYKTNVASTDESRLIIMTIIRVKPSEQNPNGIAIDGIRSVFDTSERRK